MLLPELNEDQLKALAVDIAEHGQLEPIKLTPDGQLIDGRNRLDAMGMLGVKLLTAKGTFSKTIKTVTEEGDPYVVAMSANVRRRHLTLGQRKRVAEMLLKEKPERSNRVTGKLAGIDPKTIARLRRELEGTEEIPRLDKTVGADEKARTTTRRRAKGEGVEADGAESGVKVFADDETLNGTLVERTKAGARANEDEKPDQRKEFQALARLVRATDSDEMVVELIDAVVAVVEATDEERALEELRGLVASVS
jgi:ParB-like chromosome segregation protein Spo0J